MRLGSCGYTDFIIRNIYDQIVFHQLFVDFRLDNKGLNFHFYYNLL